MVIKGLIPDTQYQFAIQAVNMHGASSHSELNDPVKTLKLQKKRWGRGGGRDILYRASW
ncbi:UNVERIFIED_CONTAM: hypothetical protein FKN15_005575 [Acipenser sinensis]